MAFFDFQMTLGEAHLLRLSASAVYKYVCTLTKHLYLLSDVFVDSGFIFRLFAMLLNDVYQFK